MELHEDFKKQTYNHQTNSHQDSFYMSISEHSNGLASTIDFKCNRKIFQEFLYVHTHNIPGGQYTKLLLQSKQLGLTDNWPEVKRKYTKAECIGVNPQGHAVIQGHGRPGPIYSI